MRQKAVMQELGERMTDEDRRYSKPRRAAAKGFSSLASNNEEWQQWAVKPRKTKRYLGIL